MSLHLENSENRLRFDRVRVTTMSVVSSFFGTQCMCREPNKRWLIEKVLVSRDADA